VQANEFTGCAKKVQENGGAHLRKIHNMREIRGVFDFCSAAILAAQRRVEAGATK
jgi:hypothetical protein